MQFFVLIVFKCFTSINKWQRGGFLLIYEFSDVMHILCIMSTYYNAILTTTAFTAFCERCICVLQV